MKHIVFILGEFFPTPTANGYCSKKIMDELKKKYKVSVICYNTNNSKSFLKMDGVEIHFLTNWLNQLRNSGTIGLSKSEGKAEKVFYKSLIFFARVMRGFISMYSWPTSESWFLKKSYTVLKKINERCKVDAVVTVSSPYEAHLSGLKFKNENPEVKWLTYTLDQFSDNEAIHKYVINKQKLNEKNLRSEREINNTADINFITESRKNWCESFPGLDNSKVQVLSFPLMDQLHPSQKDIILKEEGKIHLLYAGTFYKKIRNPEYLLKLFTSINSQKLVLHLFTKGDCDHIIHRYQELSSGRIINHGPAPVEDVHQAMEQADILVNVGNTVESQLPSKIYELVSSGKPIINLYSYDLSYKNIFMNYPLHIHLQQEEALFEENKQLFIDFCIKNKGEKIEFDLVEKFYENSTPKYVAGRFEKIIDY